MSITGRSDSPPGGNQRSRHHQAQARSRTARAWRWIREDDAMQDDSRKPMPPAHRRRGEYPPIILVWLPLVVRTTGRPYAVAALRRRPKVTRWAITASAAAAGIRQTMNTATRALAADVRRERG